MPNSLTSGTKTALDTVKKLFVIVKSEAFGSLYDTDAKKTDAVLALSKENPTKIYFVEPTSQIITQGQAFGVDAAWKNEINAYVEKNDAALTALAGADADGISADGFTINPDSAIAKYIDGIVTALTNGSVAKVTAGDGSVEIGGTNTEPTVKVVYDNDTITLSDGGLKTSLKLALVNHSEEKNETVFHDYVQLLSDNGTILSEFNADSFINDAMVDSVVYEDGYLIITWNTASADHQEPTKINLAEALKISGITSKNEDYLTVSTPGVTDSGTPYEIELAVGTNFGSLTHIDPVYDATGATTTPEGYTSVDGTATGLADGASVSTALNEVRAAISREFADRVAAVDTLKESIENAGTDYKDADEALSERIDALNEKVDNLTSEVTATDSTAAFSGDGAGVVTVGVKEEAGKLTEASVDVKVARVTQEITGVQDPENHYELNGKYYDFVDLANITPDPALATAQDVRIALEITKTNAASQAEQTVLESLEAWNVWEEVTSFNGATPSDNTTTGVAALEKVLAQATPSTQVVADLDGDTFGTSGTNETISVKSINLKNGSVASQLSTTTSGTTQLRNIQVTGTKVGNDQFNIHSDGNVTIEKIDYSKASAIYNPIGVNLYLNGSSTNTACSNVTVKNTDFKNFTHTAINVYSMKNGGTINVENCNFYMDQVNADGSSNNGPLRISNPTNAKFTINMKNCNVIYPSTVTKFSDWDTLVFGQDYTSKDDPTHTNQFDTITINITSCTIKKGDADAVAATEADAFKAYGYDGTSTNHEMDSASPEINVA